MPSVRYEGEAVEFGKLGHIRPQGQGTITYLDGHHWAGYRYEGEFLGNDNGHPHGQGRWYRYCEGEGEWRLEYEGECQQGEYLGPGTLYFFEDYFDEGDGILSEYASPGRRPRYRYEGEFSQSCPHGQGRWYRYYEGEGEWRLEYEGECQRGEYDGQGTLYNPDGSIQRQGRWADGAPIDRENNIVADANIQTRFESKSFYDAVQNWPRPHSYESVGGFLSLRKPTSPLQTIELDEDSFWLAYTDWSSFVEYALGGYASRNSDKVATVYTYSTGESPSGNSSRGEHHQKHGWHNAVFFGVVGRAEVLETIRLALVGGVGVPDDLIKSLTADTDKRSQIHCGPSPDSIAFNRMGKPSFHVEDGLVWSPHEENVWYTHPKWQPPS